MWATVYNMQSVCDFDTQLRAAAALQLPHADGVARRPLFFVRADGKAHIMLAGGDGLSKKRPGAMVCHCCGANSETVLRKFGGQEVALEGIKGHVRLTGVFCDIPADRRVSDFGAHGGHNTQLAFPMPWGGGGWSLMSCVLIGRCGVVRPRNLGRHCNGLN